MIKLEFFDPSGRMEISRRHAQRLPSLSGKRIGFVSNDQWQAYRIFPMVKTWLEEDIPGIEVLPLDTFPQGSAVIGTENTASLVQESGVDAVIIGNAA